jgi:oxepin-CoA hydrolase/3-oxo-5,6-dehydrosuberyl-CoA semialdehyde dehydrogenase
MKLQSYVAGQWREGEGDGVTLLDAVTGDTLCNVSSAGLDFAGIARHGREHGSTALRKMTFHDRALALKAMAKHLMSKKEQFYALSASTGASRSDGWIDI